MASSAKKRARADTHDALIIEELVKQGDNTALIQFMQEQKERVHAPNDWKAFQRALYRVIYHVCKLKQGDDEDARRKLDWLIRDAAVAIVEFPTKEK